MAGLAGRGRSECGLVGRCIATQAPFPPLTGSGGRAKVWPDRVTHEE